MKEVKRWYINKDSICKLLFKNINLNFLVIFLSLVVHFSCAHEVRLLLPSPLLLLILSSSSLFSFDQTSRHLFLYSSHPHHESPQSIGTSEASDDSETAGLSFEYVHDEEEEKGEERERR